MKGPLALIALAILGHGCALQLIDVRPYAAYQHYPTWRSLLSHPPAAVWGVVVQTIIVAWLSWRDRARLGSAVLGALPARVWIVFAAFTAFSLAVPTGTFTRYLGETLLAGLIALVAALNLALAAVMVPDAWLARAGSWAGERVTLEPGAHTARRRDRTLVVAAAVWVMLAAAMTSYAVLERVPHIDDSVANFFQARYFSTGRLYLPPPPDIESFRLDLTVIRDGKWFGYAFPGWPAVLAIGVLFGVPWLVNPVLAGILILIGHAWLRRRCDRGTANVAVLLLTVSSWLIFMSAEMMGHPLTAVLAMLALFAFDHATTRGARWWLWAAVAGASAGALVLTRALDGILACAAIGLIALIDRRLIRAWPAVLTTAITAAAVGALILPYNRAVTGRATYPAHVAWADARYGPGVDVLGFGPNVGIRAWPNLDPLPGHGPADVVLNVNKNLFMVNGDLFGWAAGSLLFVWLALAIARWRRDDAVLLTLPAVYAVGYSAFWFSGGPDLGARYWYPMLVPLAGLTARGAQMVTGALETRGRLTHAGGRVALMIIVASVSAAVMMLPWRATTKHYRYRGISGEARQLAATHDFDHAIVFVRAPERERDYASAFNLNPPTLEGPETIYAFDAGQAHRAAVVAHFADRPVWVIGRDASPDDAPLRVIAGPLPPGSVPE